MRQPIKNELYDNDRVAKSKIYNDKRWKSLRMTKIMENPLCEKCLEKGIITPATQVHHKKPFMRLQGQARIDAAYCETSALMSLCETCHLEIHKKKPKPDYNKFIEKIDIDGKKIMEHPDKEEDGECS